MRELQVTCVDTRDNSHEGITILGGDGWRLTRQQVIAHIENQTLGFYTLVNSKRADVRVRNGINGKYVQTQADGVWTNNLLELKACSVR